MSARAATVLATLLGAGLGGCLAQPATPGDRIECTVDADCRVDRGETCDEGVCWGDPPVGGFAAVLGPAADYVSLAATTELPALAFTPDGWFADAASGTVTLASAVRVTGEVRTPCPAALDGCVATFAVPGQLRWSRASRIPGLPDVTVASTIAGPFNGLGGGGATGFEVYLPRPAEPTTYAVTFTPSTMPLGSGLPSPASLLPPYRTTIVLDPSDEGGLVRDVMVPTSTRVVTGRIAQPGATSLAGWRVHAEAGDGTVQGALALASSITTTSATGDFTIKIVGDVAIDVVDLVLDPPGVMGGDDRLPRVRLRDHVVAANLPTITLPTLDRIIPAPIEVKGTDGNGATTRVSGAIVVARLDQEMGGVILQHETTATTADGVASLQVLLGDASLPMHYEVDVLPGPTSELASTYGVDLDVEDVVPQPPAIFLSRGQAAVGTVFDEAGFGLPGAAVTASVSAATLCQLSSDDLRVARGLAPVQATTDANGEFTLFLDPDFDGVPLTYDITIEPAAGTWAPRWTFADQALSSEHRALWVPPAAHVRAVVLDPTAAPAPDTVVTLYELTDEPAPCPQVAFGKSGMALRRAVGTSDADGVVRLILPRVE